MILKPKTVFEVGVGSLSESRCLQFFKDSSIECSLFEPNPTHFLEIRNAIGNLPNIRLYNVAISNENAYIKLRNHGSCSWLDNVKSPVVQATIFNKDRLDPKDKKIEDIESEIVKAVTFDSVDAGNIDVLFLDAEGSEWFVLEKMISRPWIIHVELFDRTDRGLYYINPHIDKILKWFIDNNYIPLKYTSSDFTFCLEKFYHLAKTIENII